MSDNPAAPPLLSIVVPVLNEAAALPSLLAALQPLREGGAELIVADGGSSDGSEDIAAGRVDRWLVAPRGRARQMNAGAGAARGQWLLFLHADTALPASPHWLYRLGGAAQPWGFFRLRLSGRQPLLRLVERGINGRSRLTAVATGDQALFVRRELFERLGGYPDIPLMEDVALCKGLRRIAAPLVQREPVITSSRRWERRGILRTVLQMWWLRLQYWRGVSPQRLWRQYYGAELGKRGLGTQDTVGDA